MSEHKEEEAFETFVDIIAKLRGENGCPWDKDWPGSIFTHRQEMRKISVRSSAMC